LKTVEGLEESCLVLPLSNKLPPFPLTLPSKAEKHFILFFYFIYSTCIIPSQHRQQLEWLTMDRRTALSHSHSSPPLPPQEREKNAKRQPDTHTIPHTPSIPTPHPNRLPPNPHKNLNPSTHPSSPTSLPSLPPFLFHSVTHSIQQLTPTTPSTTHHFFHYYYYIFYHDQNKIKF